MITPQEVRFRPFFINADEIMLHGMHIHPMGNDLQIFFCMLHLKLVIP